MLTAAQRGHQWAAVLMYPHQGTRTWIGICSLGYDNNASSFGKSCRIEGSVYSIKLLYLWGHCLTR